MNSLAGTGVLVRLALRRDRVMLPVWILTLVGFAASAASATAGLYPTMESVRDAAAAQNGTPALVALYGRVYDASSLGALAMVKVSSFGAAMVAVLTMLLVIRHTRAEEESGRLELLGATVVGRHAPVTAALLVAAGTDVVLGLLTTLGVMGAGLTAVGSIAFGLAWAGAGIAFAAVAAVAAQLTQSARTATGMTAAVLGLTYLFRAIADTSGTDVVKVLSWLSPIGWEQQVRPFAGDRWWVLLLPVGFAAVVVLGAYSLVAGRDLGVGLLPDRPGPGTATAGLRSPLALAWRLHRGSLLAWTGAFVVLGTVVGNIASTAGDFLDSSRARDFITELGGRKGLTDAFLAAEFSFVGVFGSVYGVQAAMRLRSEETALRAEPVLAAAVGRIRWAASHLTLAMAGAAALIVGAGLGAGLSYAAQTGDMDQLGRVLVGALVTLPAVWVLTGIVMAVFGLAPRLVVLGWVALGISLLLGVFGPVLRLDQWAMDVSPFAHVPRMPGAELTATPLLWLTGVAAVLITAGLVGFRRRDIGRDIG